MAPERKMARSKLTAVSREFGKTNRMAMAGW
jgi:hypothetical protein